MGRQGPVVTGIVANPTLLAWVRRFLQEKEAILEAYKKAGEAMSERLTEVVIVSGNMEGGQVTGQIAGDPAEMMAACEVALQEIEAERCGENTPTRSNTTFFDFSKRRVGT